MIKKLYFFILLLLSNHAFSQSMLDMNKPQDIKKAQVKRCIEVVDGIDKYTMYYDTNGFQMKNSFFASKIDTNGHLIDGFFGTALYAYDKNGNLIEKKSIDPNSNGNPYLITKFSYNNDNQLIKKELNQVIHKFKKNEIDTEKVITEYSYSNSRLKIEVFSSSQQTVETIYSYENSNKLNSISVKENNSEPKYTQVSYSGDTTFHKQFDEENNEIYLSYQIENKKHKTKELYVWNKLANTKYKKIWIYDEMGLLIKIEDYNYVTNQYRYTSFKYN